jgi:hypothetical protein
MGSRVFYWLLATGYILSRLFRTQMGPVRSPSQRNTSRFLYGLMIRRASPSTFLFLQEDKNRIDGLIEMGP